MEHIDKSKAMLVVALGALSSWLGVLFVPVILMVLANITDYATGLMASVYRDEEISSYKSIRGIIKKIGMWIMVEVGWILDMVVDYTIHTFGWSFTWPSAIACLVAVWIVISEIISIIENLRAMGTNVPGFVDKITDGMMDTFEKELMHDIQERKEAEKEGESSDE